MNLSPPDGYVYNGGGTYTTSGTLRLGNDCTVVGVKFTNAGREVVISGNGNTVRGCTLGANSWTALMIERGSDNVIDANTFNTVQGQGANITVTGGARNHITDNVTKGGVTAILFMWSRSSNGGGLDSIIEGNVVTGNVCSGYSEEGISFDLKANDGADAGALEYDAVRAVGGQTLTLTATGFPNYVGYDVVFVDGAMRGRTRTITGQSGSAFTVAGDIAGAKAGDHVTIGACYKGNVVRGNTVTSQPGSDPYSAVLLYGLCFGNVIEDNTIPVGKIKVTSLDYTAVASGSVTGTHGRAPCGYNTIRGNRVQDSTGRVSLEFYSLGGSLAPLVSEGNNVIGNTTPIVAADYQYMYLAGNSGTTALGNTTKAASEFVYDGE